MNQKLRAWPGPMLLVLLILSPGCRGDAAAPDDAGGPPPTGLVVSSSFRSSGRASAVASSRGPGSVAYVSMVPGSVPGGASLSIRNLSSGATATAFMADGGVDPVAIEAAEGDQLSIIVTDSAGHSTTSTESVKQRRPPRVVRTQPVRGSTDVPLNVRVAVVFSGPIDSTTVDGQAITVMQAGNPVPGASSLSPDGLMLSWTPSSQLAVATSYVVVLSQGLEDRNGFPVSGFEPVDFTTGSTIEDYGSLQIVVRTSGTPVQVVTVPALPTSGWSLQVGTMAPYRVEPGDTVTIGRLPSGHYDLTWSISPNCSPNAATPALATVTAGVTTHVAATLTCIPWTAELQATMVSDGESVPSEHQLIFRSAGYLKVITATVPANGKALIPLPEAGKLYMASLTSSNAECQMKPTSQEVTAGPGGTAVMFVKVACGVPTARNASIEIITRTDGTPVTSELWQPSPMTVNLSREGSSQAAFIVVPNGKMIVDEYSTLNYLLAGEHTLSWVVLPPNCLGGAAPAPFQVVEGQQSHVTLTANCVAWAGRLRINTTLVGPNYGLLPIQITGGGLPAGGYPLTFITPGLSGSVPIPRGEYDVWIDTSYVPCDVGENPRHVSITDFTAVLNVAITCESFY